MEGSNRGNFGSAVRTFDKALDQARREWLHNSDSGRSGMIHGLAAACEFICAVAPECGRKFSRFHVVLIAALSDLNDGVVVPMLKPVNIGRGRRTGWSRRQLTWHAAATMASLMELGRLRDDIRIYRGDAAKLAADVLSRCGVSNATPRSISNCYDGAKQHWHIFYVAGTRELLMDGIRRRLAGEKIRDLLLENLNSIARHWQAPNSV
jgi:hypothetical protein